MLKVTHLEVDGWRAAIRGMRNPMNSWDKSDSGYFPVQTPPCNDISIEWVVGKNDLDLMQRLAKAGTDHSKYLRMITVTMDIDAPLYWWKEYDTYKVGTVANSCSTMHKIHAKEFTLDDFSCEHLFDRYGDPSMNLNYGDKYPKAVLQDLITVLNHFRTWFIQTKDKRYWWQMIQLLPTSYNQKRTVLVNYAVLQKMYHARKNHKLDEWREFCRIIEVMPFAKELIIGKEEI